MTTFFALVNVPYEMLRRWFIEEKKSGKDIAKILHDKHQLTVTRNAVMGRLHRLGIARNEIAEPSRASRAASSQIVAAIPALAPLPATPIPKPVAKKKPAMPKEKSGGARFGHGRRSRLPKTRVVEMQASDLGLDSLGEFAHLKDTATAALLEKELEKPVEAIPQPPSTPIEVFHGKPVETPELDTSEDSDDKPVSRKELVDLRRKSFSTDKPVVAASAANDDPDTEDEQAFLKRQAERRAQQIPANRLVKDYAKSVMPIVRTAPKVETPRVIEKPAADPYANDPFKNAGMRRPPPESTRHKILSLSKAVEPAPAKKELAAARDVVVWSEIEELIFGPVVPRPDGRKILQHLRDADCRWPVGEDSEGRVLFCARKCEPGASVKFCPKHADGAFQGTSRTKAQSEIDRNRALMAQASKKKMPH